MSDVQVDDGEGEDEPEYLSFEDLEEAFILKASDNVQHGKDLELAED